MILSDTYYLFEFFFLRLFFKAHEEITWNIYSLIGLYDILLTDKEKKRKGRLHLFTELGLSSIPTDNSSLFVYKDIWEEIIVL